MPNKVITISLENWKTLDKMRNRIENEKKYESFNTVVSRLLGKQATPNPKQPLVLQKEPSTAEEQSLVDIFKGDPE